MSKADRLGGGSSFQRAASLPVGGSLSDRGRVKAVAEGRIPAYSIIKIPVGHISSTPLNPRRNFGTPEEMRRFGEELRAAQLAACVVVTRTAYLELWPNHQATIGDAEYVLVNGERRFRSARHVELASLDCVVRDEFAVSREEFLDKLLSENLDREDFDPVERATGVQQLVDVCAETNGEYGAQTRAAERLGKSKGWVTQQLSILTLPADVQVSVSAGETSGRDAVWMSRRLKDSPTPLSAEELFQLLEARKAEEVSTKAQRKAILAAATSDPLTAVNNPPAADMEPTPRSDGQSASPSEVLSAVNNIGAESEGTQPDREPSELLTAVNNTPAHVGTSSAPQAESPDTVVGSTELLTAVNNSTAGPAKATPEPEPSGLLTAVNDPSNEGSASLPRPRPIGDVAAGLRHQLGATPKEQADKIAQALSSEELVALVEELCTRI